MKKLRLARIAFVAGLMLARAHGQSTCINFPAGFIPFTSVTYVTAANSSGDHLVVGVPAPGFDPIDTNIPLSVFSNQTFCDAQVQLAPQQFYPNVYVPATAERAGIFNAFAGLLLDPVNNLPFPGGVIPESRFGTVFAWRIGAAQVASSNRGWSPTGSMAEGYSGQAAVLLPSGKVLVVGGNTSELYDPSTGIFSQTGPMQFPHGNAPSATLLDDGRVLIAGGTSAPSAAELYDPSSGQFTALGPTAEPHGYGHTATPLNDGRVLVAGGSSSDSVNSNAGAETFDPKTGTFAKAGVMASNRNSHTATLLAGGGVLFTGGSDSSNSSNPTPILDTAEVYDPSTGQFETAGPMQTVRAHHFAALLPSGKVLVGGGFGGDISSAELFDPASNQFTATGGLSNSARANSTANLLSSGQVLVAGGVSNDGSTLTNSAELYNPATGAFSPTGSMTTARQGHTATTLLDGRVMVAGGDAGPVSILSAELYTPVSEGLVTSQTGLTFHVAAGSGNILPQNVEVLSATDTIPWNLSVHTYQGGNWLSVTPGGGTSGPSTTPVALSISVNTAGLAAQDYYGAITLTPTDGKHPPVSIAIVLNIVPPGAMVPPVVTPSGLVFLPAAGATPSPQSLTVSNLTSGAIAFAATGTASPSWFDFSPKSGNIDAAQGASIVVTPSIASLSAGVYRGSIVLKFNDGSSQTIDLLLVIPPAVTTATAAAKPAAASPACTPSKLLPVFTSVTSGFSTPAAWPTPIVVQVVDDCGAASDTGTVTVSFSDGDSPISLLSIGSGNWTGTWVPAHTASGFSARADAQQMQLTGSVQVTLQVSSNPNVPIVGAGGVVSAGDYTSSPALGLLVSIFGSGLAGGAVADTTFPLPPTIGSTTVVLSGKVLPLLYVSDSQINAAIPFDIQPNTSQQLVVQNGNAVSVPVPVAVFDSEPAILAAAGNGLGQGLIFKVDSHGNAVRADKNSPAKAGDVLEMYAVGLGAVTPALMVQDSAPTSALTYTAATVTVTIGGVPATVRFAGLTPGFAGLYQVNVNTPSGVAPGDQAPVTLSVAGKSGQGNITIAVQ